MKIGLCNCSRTQRLMWGWILLLGVLSLVVLLALPAEFRPRCRFHALTGLPCPTCGATRCGELLFHGRLLEAARMQPLIFGVAALALPLLAYSLPALLFNWPLPRLRMESGREWRRWVAGISLLLLINWIYLVAQSKSI